MNYLILDANGLCFRKFHGLKELSFGEMRTEVIYGFFYDILTLAKKFETNKVIPCWDSRKSHRKKMYEGYKTRDPKTEEDMEKLKIIHKQISLLRKELLPQMGFRNCWYQSGYEADDLMAHFVMNYGNRRRNVVVSSDGDMLQILNYCRIYNPGKKKIITRKKFKKIYGIDPEVWAEAKAIGGCNSDTVTGIKGVADPAKSHENSVVMKYLRGELTKGKVYDRIVSEEGQALIKKNRRVVTLPLKKKSKPIKCKLKKDKLNRKEFISVFDRFGLKDFLSDKRFKEWKAFINL